MKSNLYSLVLVAGISSNALLGCGGKTFTLLTYNGGVLMQGVSHTNPEENAPKISPLLNNYDIVLFQENFVPEYGLTSEIEHKFIFPKTAITQEEGANNLSGLSRFSHFEIKNHYIWPWLDLCNGIEEDSNDCLGKKGFSAGDHIIVKENEDGTKNSEYKVVIYNAHFDAGDSLIDRKIRELQMDKTIRMINLRSPDDAVIFGGDFNCKLADYYILEKLQNETGLEDVCNVLECPKEYSLDRIYFKSGKWLNLEPLKIYVPTTFVDEKGQPLSDHNPIAVEFTISRDLPENDFF